MDPSVLSANPQAAECGACGACGVCGIDGPIPDAEAAALLAGAALA